MIRIKSLIRPTAITAGVLLTAIAGIVIFLLLFGTYTFRVHELTWQIFVQPSTQGETVVELPPFGSLTAKTHSGLLDLHVRLEQIGPQLVQSQSFTIDGQKQLVQDIQKNIPQIMVVFFQRLLFACFLGTTILAFLIWHRRYKLVLITGLLSVIMISATLLQGYLTFNPDAFREPQYHGVISAAPSLIRLANDSISKIGKIGDQTNLLIGNVESLVASTDTLTSLQNLNQDGSIKKILLVSDIHSNPVGIELIRSLVTSFSIDMIIDAGDLTDFGTILETKTIQEISSLSVPYLFSPGNHETSEMVSFMDQMPHVTVLKGTPEMVQGIKILGVPDPFSSSPEVDTKNSTEWAGIVKSTAEAAEETINQGDSPDILVIHNPEIARKVKNAPSLIVSGHTHRQSQETLKNGSLLLNPGTTGAAGIRGLYSKSSIPYSAIIVHYQPGKGPLAADFIQYDLMTQHFSLERRLETKDDNDSDRIAGNP